MHTSAGVHYEMPWNILPDPGAYDNQAPKHSIEDFEYVAFYRDGQQNELLAKETVLLQRI